jgi:hypothetical protein
MRRPPGPAHLRGPGRALRMEVAAGAPVRHGRRGRRRGRRAAAQAAPLVMVRLQLLAQRGRQRGLRLAPGRGVLRGAARARVASRTQLSLAARILLCTDPPGIAWQPARGGTALGAHSALWCTGVVQLAADRSAPAQSWPLAGCRPYHTALGTAPRQLPSHQSLWACSAAGSLPLPTTPLAKSPGRACRSARQERRTVSSSKSVGGASCGRACSTCATCRPPVPDSTALTTPRAAACVSGSAARVIAHLRSTRSGVCARAGRRCRRALGHLHLVAAGGAQDCAGSGRRRCFIEHSELAGADLALAAVLQQALQRALRRQPAERVHLRARRVPRGRRQRVARLAPHQPRQLRAHRLVLHCGGGAVRVPAHGRKATQPGRSDRRAAGNRQSTWGA